MPDYAFPAWDAAKKALAKTALDNLRTAVGSYLVNLTPLERKKYFKLGNERIPFVEKANETAHQHTGALPSNFSLTKFDNLDSIRTELSEIMNYGSDIFEGMNDAIMLAGVEELNMSNDIYKYFKITAKADTPLNGQVAEMGKVYKKTGNRIEPTGVTVPAGASIKLNGLQKLSHVVNSGKTILTCGCPDELSGKLKPFDAVDIQPGESFQLPAGHTTIIITNKDAGNPGEVTVKIA